MAYRLSYDTSLTPLFRDYRLVRGSIVLLQVVKRASPTMVLVEEGPYSGVCALRDGEVLLERGFYLFRVDSFESKFRLVVGHVGTQGDEMLQYRRNLNNSTSIRADQYLTANNYLVSANTPSEQAIVEALRANVFSRPRRDPERQRRSFRRGADRRSRNSQDSQTESQSTEITPP